MTPHAPASPINPHRSAVILTVTLSLAAAALLRRFPPEQYSFYPACPIHDWLHLQCPGCGATRALAALLHGQLTAAVHWNALMVAMLPFLLAYAATCCTRAWHSAVFHWPQPPRGTIAAAAMLTLIFTLARNL